MISVRANPYGVIAALEFDWSTVARTFEERVRWLQRPYIPIEKWFFNELYDVVLYDVLLLADGRLATYGNADSGFAIMPFTPEKQELMMTSVLPNREVEQIKSQFDDDCKC